MPRDALYDGKHSPLDPYGPAAGEIANLAWILFAGGAAIFVLVMALAVLAIWGPAGVRASLATRRAIVAGGLVFPLVVLTALLLHAFAHARAIETIAPSLRIEVIGEQWWWRVHYLDAAGATEFTTANEIIIPVGTAVRLSLRSADVIHSFWVPSLAGKIDMIPGRTLSLRVSANHAGTYRGQCAEFCGGPHARMALHVIAVPVQAFDAWQAVQRSHAIAARSEEAARGEALFASRGCSVCHAIRGTQARGTRGPDLTHVGGRSRLGAGVLVNGVDGLTTWIVSNQDLKPGNLMPSYAFLPPDELRTIALYLEGLR